MSTTVTEREAVMRERAAAQRALAYFNGTGRGADRAQQLAVEWFPLPKVQRPRVVRDTTTDGYSIDWRVVDGVIEYRRRSDIGWICVGACGAQLYVNAERVRFLADLLANPTELVDDDGFQGVRDGGDTT